MERYSGAYVDCAICNKQVFRKQWQIDRNKSGKFYCSHECLGLGKLNPLYAKVCTICKKEYRPSTHSVQGKMSSKYCSFVCKNKSRLGIKLGKRKPKTEKKPHWKSRVNLETLRTRFNFSSCMIEGCTYDKVYEIHRFIEGRNGGEYVVGNMFAICPNHHAEITRKLIVTEKVNDYCLRIVKE